MPFLAMGGVAQRNPPVHAAALAPGGEALAESFEYVTAPGVINIHDLATGKLRRWEYRGHTDAINTMVYSSDGRMLASCDCSGVIRIWETATGKERASFKHEPRRAWSLAFSPNGKTLASSSPSRVVLWELATGKQRAVIETVGGEVNSVGPHCGCPVVFSPNGATLAYAQSALHMGGDEDWAMRLFNAETCKEQLVLRGHSDAVLDVAFSPNGRTVATASRDKTVQLWDAETGRRTGTFHGHKGPVVSVVFSPDGRMAASWCYWREKIKQGEHQGNDWYGTELKVWEVATRKERLTLEPDQPEVDWWRPVFVLQFSSNGKELLTVSADHQGVDRFDIVKLAQQRPK
jgi:WD40 repeat protein